MAIQVSSTVFISVSLFCASLGIVDRSEVSYYLFNKNTNDIKLNDTSLDLVDTSLPIIFIIHAYADFRDDPHLVALRKLYLQKSDVNVIAVDWFVPAHELYPQSVKDTKYVGQYIGEFINTLYVKYNADPSKVELIANSLGAQVCGFAGQAFQHLSSVSIGRITALDAALPLFADVGDEERLSKDDAELVVAIHTDGGVNGFLDPIGDIDFFPNGGKRVQPACVILDVLLFCSHTIVRDYYLEALKNPEGFVSKQCDSYENYKNGLCDGNKALTIGGDLSLEDAGLYYLRTNPLPPYSKE